MPKSIEKKQSGSPRTEAYRLLLRYEESLVFPNLLLGKRSERSEGEAQNRRLLVHLFYGVVEKRLSLDYAIAHFTKKPASALENETRTLLRLGLYQLYFLDKIPAYAAVKETVALARNPGERALLNAVLRRASVESMPLPLRERNPARYLSVAYSFPLPTVKFFLSLYGESEAEALLLAFSQPPTLTLRVNSLRVTRDAYISMLAEKGIAAEPTRYAKNGVRLPSSYDPVSLPGYLEGLFFVQDEASQIEGEALGASFHERILDICACPGGKSFQTAIEMGDTGEVLSCDISAHKLSLLSEGAQRLGLSSVTPREQDGTQPVPEWEEAFDRVIADLPCSGFGVFGKKPDLRYAPIERLTEILPLQAAILENAARYVRRGGVLLYSTCTLNPDENEKRVASFLLSHPDFVWEDFSVGALSSEKGCLTLLPHKHACDGFFIARLRRKQDA